MKTTQKENIVGKFAILKLGAIGVRAGTIGLIASVNGFYPSGTPAEITILVEDKIETSNAFCWYVLRDINLLLGKSFCITGPLRYVREFYISVIKMCGGTYKSSVTKDLNYLVTNEHKATSKRLAAQEHNVPIITEGDFLRMLQTT
jgi:DNA ligase (NAD+)